MKLKINRKRWFRGKGSEESKLLRAEDRKMCCLGFYLRACGVSVRGLTDETLPSDMLEDVPKKARWLLKKTNEFENSSDCQYLIDQNDTEELNELTREKRIAARFQKHGVDVEFV